MNRRAFRECRVEEHKVNGVCIKCDSTFGHGPRFQYYDRAAGDYVTLEGKFCTARWATTGARHVEGEICGDPDTEKIGDFYLCEYHRDRLYGWEVKRKLWGDQGDPRRADRRRQGTDPGSRGRAVEVQPRLLPPARI